MIIILAIQPALLWRSQKLSFKYSPDLSKNEPQMKPFIDERDRLLEYSARTNEVVRFTSRIQINIRCHLGHSYSLIIIQIVSTRYYFVLNGLGVS